MRRAEIAVALAIAATCACNVEAPQAREEVADRAARDTSDGKADAVFGQPGLGSGAPPVQVSTLSVAAPAGLGADPDFYSYMALWIADVGANRLLARDQTNFAPMELHGQPTYVVGDPNAGQADVNRLGFAHPLAVAYSGARSEWLAADTDNHRVLRGFAGSDPGYVYGQHGDFQSNVQNETGISAGSLSSPKGVAIDSYGNAYVADAGNHRVLRFAPFSTYANWAFGQPDMVHGDPNAGLGHPTESALDDPHGVAVSSSSTPMALEGIWIADTGNHRVLHARFDSFGADVVLGQASFATNDAMPASPTSLLSPTAVAPDREGGVWIADTGHHRVVHFKRGETSADHVLGQPDFVHGDPPASTSPTTLDAPTGVAVGWNGDLFVADTGSNRVLRYHVTCASAADCDDRDPCTDDTCTPQGCAHVLSSYSSACAPYLCRLDTRQCQTSCLGTSCQGRYTCSISSGRCVLSCVRDADCATDATHPFCRNGFCCDGDCRGLCETCGQPGQEGTCSAAYGNPRPDPLSFHSRACPGADVECAGQCDGSRRDACTPAYSGTACGVEGCADGVARSRGTCDGAGTCLSATHACGAYACLPGGCTTSCEGDSDCAAGAYCVNGACAMAGLAPAGGGCALGGAGGGDDGFPLAIVGFAIALPGLARKARRARRRR